MQWPTLSFLHHYDEALPPDNLQIARSQPFGRSLPYKRRTLLARWLRLANVRPVSQRLCIESASLGRPGESPLGLHRDRWKFSRKLDFLKRSRRCRASCLLFLHSLETASSSRVGGPLHTDGVKLLGLS